MKNYLKLGIFLFVIPLILWNCENQEENFNFEKQLKYNTVSLQKAKQLFNYHKEKEKTKYNYLQKGNNESLIITPNWNTQTQDSLNFTDALLTNVKADLNIDINFRIRLIFLEVNNKTIEAIESVNGTAFYDDGKLKNGKVYFHSFLGTYLFGYKVEDGKAISRFVPKKTINTANIFSFMYLFQSECEEDYDPGSTFCDNELDEIVISNGGSEGTPYVSAFAEDTVNEGGGGGTGESGDDSGGGGNGNDSQNNTCSGGKVYNSSTETCECPSGKVEDGNGNCVEDDQIINNLSGKADCIYEELQELSTGFKNAIQKFDGEFPVSHLKLTINNSLGSGVYGETQPPVNYVTEIQINGDGLSNLSDLGAATTLAHEIVHAEIFRKMLSAAQRGDLNTNNMTEQEAENYVNSLKDNFPGLYDYYVERWHPTWNHNLMASHYINTIADIIQDFDNNRLSRSTYESIAWAGLGEIENNQSTVAWQNLTSSEQQVIIDVLNQYFFNGTSNCD